MTVRSVAGISITLLAGTFVIVAIPLIAIFIAAFIRYDFTSCTGITFDRPYTPRDVRTLHGDGRIRFVPLDDFDAPTLRDLASYYDRKYGVRIEVAAPLRLPASTMDAYRGQLVADAIIETLQQQHPQPATGPLVVIGFTGADMYIPSFNWRFAISARSAAQYAVVSTARLGLGCLGLVPASHKRMISRLRKMTTKNIGILYFGLPLSADPRSVLYGSIGGLREVDRMSEDF